MIRNPACQRKASPCSPVKSAKFPSLASSAGRSPNSARSAGLSKHSLSSTAKTFWTISGFALPRQFFTQDSKPCAGPECNQSLFEYSLLLKLLLLHSDFHIWNCCILCHALLPNWSACQRKEHMSSGQVKRQEGTSFPANSKRSDIVVSKGDVKSC